MGIKLNGNDDIRIVRALRLLGCVGVNSDAGTYAGLANAGNTISSAFPGVIVVTVSSENLDRDFSISARNSGVAGLFGKRSRSEFRVNDDECEGGGYNDARIIFEGAFLSDRMTAVFISTMSEPYSDGECDATGVIEIVLADNEEILKSFVLGRYPESRFPDVDIIRRNELRAAVRTADIGWIIDFTSLNTIHLDQDFLSDVYMSDYVGLKESVHEEVATVLYDRGIVPLKKTINLIAREGKHYDNFGIMHAAAVLNNLHKRHEMGRRTAYIETSKPRNVPSL